MEIDTNTSADASSSSAVPQIQTELSVPVSDTISVPTPMICEDGEYDIVEFSSLQIDPELTNATPNTAGFEPDQELITEYPPEVFGEGKTRLNPSIQLQSHPQFPQQASSSDLGTVKEFINPQIRGQSKYVATLLDDISPSLILAKNVETVRAFLKTEWLSIFLGLQCRIPLPPPRMYDYSDGSRHHEEITTLVSDRIRSYLKLYFEYFSRLPSPMELELLEERFVDLSCYCLDSLCSEQPNYTANVNLVKESCAERIRADLVVTNSEFTSAHHLLITAFQHSQRDLLNKIKTQIELSLDNCDVIDNLLQGDDSEHLKLTVLMQSQYKHLYENTYAIPMTSLRNDVTKILHAVLQFKQRLETSLDLTEVQFQTRIDNWVLLLAPDITTIDPILKEFSNDCSLIVQRHLKHQNRETICVNGIINKILVKPPEKVVNWLLNYTDINLWPELEKNSKLLIPKVIDDSKKVYRKEMGVQLVPVNVVEHFQNKYSSALAEYLADCKRDFEFCDVTVDKMMEIYKTMLLNLAKSSIRLDDENLNWKDFDATIEIALKFQIGPDQFQYVSSKFPELLKVKYVQAHQKFTEQIKQIWKTITNLKHNVNHHFEKCTCFSPKYLEQIKQEFVSDADRSSLEIVDTLHSYLGECLFILWKQFEHRNNTIISHEQGLVQEAIEMTKQFYQEEMTHHLMMTKVYSQSTLQNIHKNLLACLCKVFKKACNFQEHSGLENQYCPKLNLELDELFAECQKKNDKKIRDTKAKFLSCFQQRMLEYNAQISGRLSKSTQPPKESEFRKLHFSIGNEVLELFAADIAEFDYMKDEQIQKFKMELDAEFINRNNGIQEKRALETKDENRIVIEFGLKFVRCGLIKDGCFQLIPDSDEDGQYEIPNVLGFSDTEILVGSKAQTCTTKFVIEELLLEKVVSTNCPIHWKGETAELRFEGIVGIVLGKIKLNAEKYLKSPVLGALITIPIWLNSQQRQGMKDAASIAGFKKVELLSELSAAALNFSFRPRPFLGRVCIISQTEASLDVALFQCNSGQLCLKKSSGTFHHINKNATTYGQRSQNQPSVQQIMREVIDYTQIYHLSKLVILSSTRSTVSQEQVDAIYDVVKAIRPTLRPHIMDKDTFIIEAAAKLSHGKDVEIKEAYIYSITLEDSPKMSYGTGPTRYKICKRNDPIIENEPIRIKLNFYWEAQENLTICERIGGVYQKAGRITVKFAVKVNHGPRMLVFSISNEGILRFETMFGNSSDTITFHGENLSDVEINEMKSMVDGLVQSGFMTTEFLEAIDVLMKEGEIVQTALTAKKFKTFMVRNEIQKLLSEITALLDDPKFSLDKVKCLTQKVLKYKDNFVKT